ncbi:AAA family ATPase [Azospirillum thermophilum]|nr:AAA family ATPase [Azospirillum thermophilum]
MRGEDMRGFREGQGLSQPDFAIYLNEKLGRRYGRQQVSRWENGAERIPEAVASLLRKEMLGPDLPHGPALLVVLTNQKGGVGKTTSAVNVASILAQDGYKVLLIDADAQANATLHLGVNAMERQEAGRTLYDVLTGKAAVRDCVVTMERTGLDLLPSSIRLSQGEVELAARPASNFILRGHLSDIRKDYDFILIDCPPNLGQMTLNGLTAADLALIPCQAELMAIAGVDYLLQTIEQLRRLCHPDLSVLGLVPTMYTQRNTQDRESLSLIHERYGQEMRIFEPVPRSTTYAQSVAAGRATIEVAPEVAGGAVFRSIANALIAERGKRFGTPEVPNAA